MSNIPLNSQTTHWTIFPFGYLQTAASLTSARQYILNQRWSPQQKPIAQAMAMLLENEIKKLSALAFSQLQSLGGHPDLLSLLPDEVLLKDNVIIPKEPSSNSGS